MDMSNFESLTVLITACGVLIALGGLIVSIVSLRKSNSVKGHQERLQRKQEELTDLQLRLLKTEAERSDGPSSTTARADVRFSLEGSANEARFYVRNWGLGPANNVDFVLTSKGKETPIVKNDYEDKFPIPRLSPGSEVSLIAALTFGTGTVFDARWWWADEDGLKHEESTRLSL